MINRTSYSLLLLSVMGAFWLPSATAGQWDFDGQASLETRYFPYAPEFPSQKNSPLSPSVTLEPEFVYELDNGNDRFTFMSFARLDADDKKRTHADLRELSWLHLGSSWDMTTGISKVYWGVTESAHLVDIINQTDAVEDITGEDKLGQPMVNLNIEQDWGTLNLFVLPGFRERTFTANNARLHGPLPVDSAHATFESGKKARHIDFATRWSQTFGDVDLAISQFIGTSREPRLIPQLKNSQLILVPHYDLISQTGVEFQWTTENTLWKAEGISRMGQGKQFFATATGFEHTFYDLAERNIDIGVLLEYLYDGRDVNLAPVSIANHDIFAGFRITLNDTQDTAILFGTMYDHHTKAAFINLEAERRLTNQLKLKLNSRFITNVPSQDPLAYFRNDDFLELKLHWFF